MILLHQCLTRISCLARQDCLRHSAPVFPPSVAGRWLQLCCYPAAGSSTALSACIPLTLVKRTGSQIHSPPFSLAVDLGAIFIWAAGTDLLWLQAVKQQLGRDSAHAKYVGEENI